MQEDISTQLETDILEHLPSETHTTVDEDYSTFTKNEFVKIFEKYSKIDITSTEYAFLKKLKPYIEQLFEEEKNQALEKFTIDGTLADDFEFRGDVFYDNFEKLYQKARTTYQQNQKQFIQKKETNYQAKIDLLKNMRALTEGSANKNAFDKFKEYQLEWKNIGVVPADKATELWSTYNAVCNRFYDNRSIANELLDLDRKKNLAAKLLLCDKADALINESSIKKALLGLEELHEEFRHIGPVPRDQQEVIWQRLKDSSDKIHEKKKALFEEIKLKQEEILSKKQEILDKIKIFETFTSLSPGQWADKTKELDVLQLEWKSSGVADKDKAKQINDTYWESLKLFYNNKRAFFKTLESEKNDNLTKKTTLCEKAEALISSEDANATKTIIDLQRDWKTIGHVPLKHKDKIYERFKKACDGYFEVKRNAQKEIQNEAKNQLKSKIDYVNKIELVEPNTIVTVAQINTILEEWKALPQSADLDYSKVYMRFAEVIKLKLKDVIDADELKKDAIYAKLLNDALKFNPDYEKELQFRERKLRKEIRDIEDNMAQYANNMEFFARAKNADAIRKEFTDKVAEEQKKLEIFKSRLKIMLTK